MKLEWESILSLKQEGTNWENIYSETYRAKIIGGWLVKEIILIDTDDDSIGDRWSDARIAMIFIPDANHEWKDK